MKSIFTILLASRMRVPICMLLMVAGTVSLVRGQVPPVAGSGPVAGNRPVTGKEAELIEGWQSLREQLRASVAPLRQPEFEIRVLARSSESNATEQFSISKMPAKIVLVVGGLQGDINACEKFAMSLQRELKNPANTSFAVFHYPNDGPIEESGRVLRQLLDEFRRGSPKTKVSIVAHSMGGLVARCAIELEQKAAEPASPCIVDHLTLVCPPNNGSVLAQYGDALELADALSKMRKGTESLLSIVNSLVDDGLGEACDELRPSSELLTKLNSSKRVQGVRYTIIAGTRGPISPFVKLATSIALNESQAQARVKDFPKAEEALRRVTELITCDELSQGLGDGAVSLASAQLPGVSEFIKMPIQHAEWTDIEKPQIQELLRKIASLLTPI